MILVRMVFQTKWGQAQPVVDEMKRMAEKSRGRMKHPMHGRILTDLSGPFHTVVQEMEFESLAEWEKARAEMFSSPEMQDMQSQEIPFEGGRAEFYTIEAEI